ncbi:MAG TPA: ATP-dependent 6-phosphofructokinase [Candidatus Omnitrophica bacterium]|nr:ATP-dependent 6-phosphofructokinase [Candidatus Omnitrophota bacterium]
MARIGILTGGGDCPGLNPVIRAVVRKAINHNFEVVGIKNGWKGMLERDTLSLDLDAISGILPKGGTILGTSRTNPYKKQEDVQRVVDNFKQLELTALIAVGGEDTLGVAARLYKDFQLPLVGIPKTIDNDIAETDFSFGFDTAVNIAMECIDRLHTTAESHHRIMVVETMGRHAGWIATYAGLAGGADAILIPEKPIDIDEVCSLIMRRHGRGKNFSIVVVAEGAKFKEGTIVTQEGDVDEFGHVRLGGVGHVLARLIQEKTGYETRVTVLGHIQRGGSPTAFDRILGTRYGIRAVELIMEGKYGYVVCLKGNRIEEALLENVLGKIKPVDEEIYRIAETFFG